MALSHVEFFAELDPVGAADPVINVTGVAWAAGDRLVVFTTGKDGIHATAAGATNANLTFTQEHFENDTQNQVWASLLKSGLAAGAQSSQTIAVAITSPTTHDGGCSASVLVLSGDEPDIHVFVGGDVGATDNTAATIDITTTEAVARLFYLFQTRQRNFTVDGGDGLTMIRNNDFVGTGGNISGHNLYYKDVSSAGTYNGSGTLSAAGDWCAIAAAIYEAGGGGSPVTGFQSAFIL